MFEGAFPSSSDKSIENSDLGDQSHRLSEALSVAESEGLITHREQSLAFKFSHDKIQQSAYSLIADENGEKEKMHLQIGRHLEELYNQPESREEWMRLVFVDQLNRGSRLIVDEEERMRLAHLNVLAAEKLISQPSFFPASEYLKVGLDLMEGMDGWKRSYKLQLNLCTRFAEVAYYIGDVVACDEYVSIVLEHAINREDRYPVYTVKLDSLGSQERLSEAIDVGFEILSLLGEKFPRKITHFHVATYYIKSMIKIRGKSDEDLLALPTLDDADKLLALKIMSIITAYAWSALRPNVTALLCLRMFLISINDGLSKYSAYAFAVFGYVKGGNGQFDDAYRFGQLAENLMDRFRAKDCDAASLVVVNSFIAHLRRPLQLGMDAMLKAYQYGMETGDIYSSSNGAAIYSIMYYFSGLPLGPLLDDLSAFAALLDRYNQATQLSLVLVYNQAVLNLMGRSRNPVVLTGTAVNQDEYLKDTNSSNGMGKERSVWFLLNHLGFFFGDLDVASKYGELMWKNRCMVNGSNFYMPAYLMFLSLTALEMARRTGKRKYRYNARKHMKMLAAWVENKALNAQHKLMIVLADMSISKKRSPEIVKSMFDDAISAAKRSGFTQDAALASEVAGRYFVSVSDKLLASSYLSGAKTLYDEWGAQAKIDQLETEYDFLSTAEFDQLQLESTNLRGRQRFPARATAWHHQFNPYRSYRSLVRSRRSIFERNINQSTTAKL